jgi:DUF4097 and DUF4098 domain-containing protein YvlB
MKTKKFYCKILLALLAIGLLPGTGVLAQQYEKSRSLVQSYPTTDETSVQIINKYGNIHILPWEEDSIRFEINIKVEANKQSKADKTYDNIDIEFSETSYYVIAQTIFGNKKNAFWADVSDFTSSMLNTGANAQIDYTVYIPSHLELSIELKFGSIYMTDHHGKTTVFVSNGDFRGGSFNDLDLDHSFGNVVIDSIQSGSLSLGYTELRLKHAGDIRITSKSSKPEIGSFNSIRLNSKRDTYFFEEAGAINGETSFSYLTIETLNGNLNLETNYGNLTIGDYGKEFNLMNLNGNYTDVNLVCGDNPGYSFEAYYNHKTKMIYPNEIGSFENKELDSDKGEYLLSGQCGRKEEGAPRIKITMNGGSINLIHH